MSLKIEQVLEPYLQNTQLDNLFINEYLTAAPSDYVKVYVYALMHAQLGSDLENSQIAEDCSMNEDKVEEAWDYWNRCGCIRKIYREDSDELYDIEFVRMKYLLYANDRIKEKAPLTILEDSKIKGMYDSITKLIKRPLGGKEPIEIMNWINDFKIDTDLVVMAYSLCVSRGKDSVTAVGKIVSDWAARGLKTAVEVEKYLEDVDLRHSMYRRVMKALGFTRNATEAEKQIIDTWFDRMSYDIEKILEACAKTSGISNPNINYVNKVLINWFEEKNANGSESIKPAGDDIAITNKYLEYLREFAEKTEKEHRAEIYAKIPRIKEIENESRNLGMQISKVMVSTNANKLQLIAKLKKDMKTLEEEKYSLLSNAGYEKDYLSRKYRCPICMDTGRTDEGLKCACLAARMEEAKEWQKKNAKI